MRGGGSGSWTWDQQRVVSWTHEPPAPWRHHGPREVFAPRRRGVVRVDRTVAAAFGEQGEQWRRQRQLAGPFRGRLAELAEAQGPRPRRCPEAPAGRHVEPNGYAGAGRPAAADRIGEDPRHLAG